MKKYKLLALIFLLLLPCVSYAVTKEWFLVYSGKITPPTPIPPQGLYDWTGSNEPSGSVPSGAHGFSFTLPWGAIEPTKGNFNWIPITQAESLLKTGQTLQVSILTGAMSPTTVGACTAAQNYPGVTTGVGLNTTCVPWLGPTGDNVTGVSEHWDYGFLISNCTVTFEPSPADTTFQTDIEALFTAFNSQFHNDTKVGLVSIQPVSHYGFDISIAKASTASGCTESYTSAWATLCVAQGGCSSTSDETGWKNWITTAFETIYANEISTLSNKNLMLWPEPQQVTAIISSTNSCVFKSGSIYYDGCLSQNMFTYANTHKPAGGGTEQCGNEAMNTNNNWYNTTSTYCNGADNWGGQGVANIDTNCTSILSAYTTYGCSLGATFAQVYAASFTHCASTISSIVAACSGY